MLNIYEALCAPGSRKPVTRTAATQVAKQEALVKVAENDLESQPTAGSLAQLDHIVDDEEKARLLDRWLDTVVAAAGSPLALLTTTVVILVWALMGIRFGHSENWQVVISDVQAVFCYIFDSLLMRQQLNSYDRSISISATFQSRALGIGRMLRQLKTDTARGIPCTPLPVTQGACESNSKPKPSRINTAIFLVGRLFGHMVTLIVFWVGIFIWLGLGNYCAWSVPWQLYINSATSALMMLVFALIACVREQSRAQASAYLGYICHLDMALEYQLRQMTQDKMPNEEITIYPRKVSRLERAISYYADLVGTLTGIALLMSVIVIWVAIGPSIHFNSNWWLIIGTYAGLIGMHDGFVLHNIQSQLNEHEHMATDDVSRIDAENLAVVDLAAATCPCPSVATSSSKGSITQWLSCRLSQICAHEFAVVVGILVIIGLVVAATVMEWSITGQLLCNIPPSIIETFIMMALITGHELEDRKLNQRLTALATVRETLTRWVAEVEAEAKAHAGVARTKQDSNNTSEAVMEIGVLPPTSNEKAEEISSITTPVDEEKPNALLL